jgi:alpha-1,3-rhamnosyl/mannosyltransferase
VVTVHDLQYLRFPEYFSTVKRRYLSIAVPRAVAVASVVAVPSEFVKSTVVEAFGLDPHKVMVVPHGFDAPSPPEPESVLPPLHPVPTVATDEATIRSRYRLDGKRILVLPAITHPHKGHRFLVDLLARAGEDTPWTDADTVLVLLGGAGRADGEVTEAIARHRLGDRVRRLGRVPAADRDGIIAAADALVFPSQYEGFGAPVLEAMALGTPVICSDQASLPEVAGDAAVVRPLTADAWADALDEVDRRRDELVTAGRAQAATFSTEASGAALAAAYRRAADDRTGLERRA